MTNQEKCNESEFGVFHKTMSTKTWFYGILNIYYLIYKKFKPRVERYG